MAEVRYRDYRKYEKQRDVTNTAVMGLLAASHMTSGTLRVHSGSTATLSQLYPTVPYVHRFNLRVDVAQNVLDRADGIVSLLGIPQVIAIHEDVLKGMLRLIALHTHGVPRSVHKDASASTIHERMSRLTGVEFGAEAIELFHLMRVARNTHIHAGGRADANLVRRRDSLSCGAEHAWSAITTVPLPEFSEDHDFQFRHSDLIVMLAVTKRLAREANQMLQGCLPREVWADMALADWRAETARRHLDRGQVENKAMGFAKRYYGALGLTTSEVSAAVSRESMAGRTIAT